MKGARSRWGVALAAVAAALNVVAAGALPDLEGTWAMLQVYPRIAELPLVGDSAQTSYVIQLVDVGQEGALLRMDDRYCFTYIEENTFLAKTEIPDAFMRSLMPHPREASVREQNGEICFEQPSYVEVRGAILENPETDVLPLGPEDPRVVDQDADGFPGMTVNVSLLGLMQAQIYVVQRVQYALQGVVVSPDRIEGLVDWTDEQVILSATSPLLLAGAESRPDPDPAKHIFVMLRAQEAWTCEWLRDHWREVFGVGDGI
ncbi:MAG: hypothetical protein AB1778_01915 [Candidatus Bipolaricaulota bacterium]